MGSAKRYYVTDTDLSDRFPIYTRANVGEVFPDPVTPLTSGTGLWRAERGWRTAWERMGAFELGEFPVDEFCQLGVVGGYCYLNASLIRLFGERAPGLSWQDMDAQFFGAQPGIPAYVEAAGDVRPDLTQRIGETFGAILAFSSVDQLSDVSEHKARTIALRRERPDFSEMPDGHLWARYLELIAWHEWLFSQHIYTTYMATVPVGMISAIATTVGRPDLVMPLIAGFGDVDSAEPSHALWAMGRLVANSSSLTAAFDAGVSGLLGRLRTGNEASNAQFLAMFDDFVLNFGSRGPNEWEARSPTWETRPELALSAIERMRLAPASADPATHSVERARERAAAAEQLLALVAGDPAAHGQLSVAIAASQAWIPARERTKTNNIRLIHECRMPMRELGRRMVERGFFDEVEDFGFVQAEEMEALIGAAATDSTKWRALVRERRATYEELSAKTPQFVFVGTPASPDTWEARSSSSAGLLVAGEALQGMPGCPGVVRGRARVVLDSNDPAALEPGDVLVAPITDPSWTPLFVPAAGVVVDVGAPLSHAIIVSRELGIPCVISATDATRRIRDGALLEVNGSTGVVTVLGE
jgi:phosphohistidine swiveling domain-containing protein